MTGNNGMGYNMNLVPQGYVDGGNGGMFGGNSYSEGFSRGYSEAMRQSGHYPMLDGRMW